MPFRDLIEENELEQAIELLRSQALSLHADGLLRADQLDRVRNFSAQVKDLRREYTDGEITRDQWKADRSGLRKRLLALVDDIERATSPVATPSVELPAAFAPSDVPTHEAIFGISQLRSVGWLRRGLELARAVCRVSRPLSNGSITVGTAFHIGRGLILTNHHVLPTLADADAARVIFEYEEDGTGCVKGGTRYGTVAGSWRSEKSLDCAVVRVDRADVEAWGKLEPEVARIPRKGEHVTIIQHPQGGPKQIAMTANEVRAVSGDRLWYTTDTLPGSSGSPVFNDDWRVVALHIGESKSLKNEDGSRVYANVGVLMKHVIEALDLTIT
ncbi:trypsin-like peptidase domain-containing protein [Polyangium sorediatum]|uniref:Serine protease n=1 Tax=Polyangium sorediatum TaxID=889274 RepID=A0ABT6NWP5_9BACT|nr:trypsin-like peptidase domain-containing protein [Polyangium sorediatum]MDI1432756.1 trypsin-like peptidase domain-containing protein [Polyangium sorediatum]